MQAEGGEQICNSHATPVDEISFHFSHPYQTAADTNSRVRMFIVNRQNHQKLSDFHVWDKCECGSDNIASGKIP